MPCIATSDLVNLALGHGSTDAVLHADACARCRERVDRLRLAASAVRTGTIRGPAPTGNCLTDGEIADLVDGVDTHRSASAGHVAACAHCSARLAAVSRLLSDGGVIAELSRLAAAENVPTANRRRGYRIAGVAATLAAAGLSAVLFTRPGAPPVPIEANVEVLRESAITSTVAPRILGPAGTAGVTDSMRWTSVPYADRYRIRVFDREATLVWETETRDTVVPLPVVLTERRAGTYLWNVQARTSWDRWVDSEWVDLTIGGPR